jgi:UDP-glucose 4-epimerase
MSILVTGGAGYIGSHVTKQLLLDNQDVVVLDNLSTGSQRTLDTLRKIKDFHFENIDLNDFGKVKEVFDKHEIDTIIHFAASIVVPESVENPLKYYMNNTVNTTNLIKCAVDAKVKKFIFSSTAAVYGEPKDIPSSGVDENYETAPINPYGMSKLMSERVIQDTAAAHSGFKYVIFRYFNVSGADIFYDGDKLAPRIGQSFPNATHLIKIASECALGKRERMYIFGDDYDTPDGTGVRDYIHIDDLADAHIKAISYLDEHESDIFNAGYSKGFSVKEVVDTMREVTGKEIVAIDSPRRAGDPGKLISNSTKIREKMKWKPKYDDLGLICQSAYAWEKKL